VFKQSGVIPYRVINGKVEILLITSSKRKRWVIPKGWVEPYLSSANSAAKEAREEAGVLGTVITPAIGSYKRHAMGVPYPVEVFLMQVEVELENWAEASWRQRKWLSLSEAIVCVKPAKLRPLFNQIESALTETANGGPEGQFRPTF
jgi:8-oxo-dGTP pyrophosphatase MutT (NUDIX family)